MRTRVRDVVSLVAAGLLLFGPAATTAWAQTPASTALVKELTDLMGEAGLDALAAQDLDESDRFVAALLFAGRQLLVVSAQYEAPSLLAEQIGQKNYRGVYGDLQGGSIAETKLFASDLGADGLEAQPGADQAFDTFSEADESTTFDADWARQNLSESQYMAAFASADGHYAKMLKSLISELQ